MTTVRTYQKGDSINETNFVGIVKRGNEFVAVGNSFSKTFKTENGARKHMRKYGYEC